MGCIWFFIVASQIVYAVGYYGRKQTDFACDPLDPVPPRRIDLRRIKGEWKDRFVKLPRRLPLELKDTVFDIVVGLSLKNGSQVIETKGRSVLTCDPFTLPLVLEETESRNLFRQLTPGFTVAWRFLDTFKDYLITQTCLELDEFLRCPTSFINVYSRTLKPIPLADLKKINQSLRKIVCVDLFDDMHEEARSDLPDLYRPK